MNQGSEETALVSVNMGAIPENLFESEMFGHTKGAFTGAHQARIGRFELAENGTLFLDEVANIPAASQAKLLRVLESGHFERVGSSITQTANVRIVSATNGDFGQLIGAGLFRQDLYYRLNTIELVIPPLRQRRQDIPALADIMLQQQCNQYNKPAMTLLPCAIERLCGYDFPGNLRELSHILERVALLHKAQQIRSADLMMNDAGAPQNAAPIAQSKTTMASDIPLMTMAQAEVQLLEKALLQCQGQTPEAAIVLGLSKSAIYRRLEKYNISAKDYLNNPSSD
jgi:DNA-binding NtrC family response regulator